MQQIENFLLNDAVQKSLIGIVCFLAGLIIPHLLAIARENYKDRVRLTTSSQFFKEYRDEMSFNPSSIKVKIVNDGKRPIILTSLIFEHDDGSTHGIVLGSRTGMALKQDEHFFTDFSPEDSSSMVCCHERGTDAVNIYFCDTHDRKYYVKDAKKNLKRIWDEMKESAQRQKLLLVS